MNPGKNEQSTDQPPGRTILYLTFIDMRTYLEISILSGKIYWIAYVANMNYSYSPNSIHDLSKVTTGSEDGGGEI